MNCLQTKSRLVAYINGEVSSLEKESIQTHLVDCLICQGELQMLSDLENRLKQHLYLQAERVHSAPQAWNTLQARIFQKGSERAFAGVRSFTNLFQFKKHTARSLALVLMVILVLLLAAPPALTLAARISDWVVTWFRFDTPGIDSRMSVGGFNAFTPYAPQYLPKGFDSSGLGGTNAPGLDQLQLTYSNDNQFVTLLQSKGSGAGDLPQGKNVDINNEAGVFVQIFATSSEQLLQKIPSIPIVTNFDYRRTSLLAWNIGEIKIELVSNLPEAEILKIAQSLTPAESEEGEPPSNQEP